MLVKRGFSFLLIIFFLMFSGCYSSMHQGQVTDGPNISFALRPLHHATDISTGPNGDGGRVDIVSSTAFRYGWAASQEGKRGHSIGLLFDWYKEGGPFLVRGNYYRQFPKNSYLDVGIGGEIGIWPPIFPLIPYAVISRNLGTRLTVYSEVRGLDLPPDVWIVPTLGAGFDVSKHFSLFVEMNLSIEDEVIAPVIGLGINLHRRQDFENREQKAERLPLSPIRISGEILAGGAVGFVGYVAGYRIGAALIGEESVLDWTGTLALLTIHIFGSAMGVYIVGNIGNETGSFSATLSGSILGGYASVLLPPGLLVLPPIGATIGFNLTRRYESPPESETALINFSNGQMRLAVPSIYIRHDSFDGITRSVDLVKARF